MLVDHPIEVVLLATDLETSKDFYEHKRGLRIVSENDRAVTWDREDSLHPPWEPQEPLRLGTHVSSARLT